MKYCTECGKELEKDASVCGNCGKKIVLEESLKTADVQSANQASSTSAKQTNGLAIAGFVIAIVSSTCCCGTLSWLSLIFSIIGLSESKKKDGSGKGLAIAGIIISAIAMCALIIFFITGFIGSFMEGVKEGISEGVGTSL